MALLLTLHPIDCLMGPSKPFGPTDQCPMDTIDLVLHARVTTTVRADEHQPARHRDEDGGVGWRNSEVPRLYEKRNDG